MPESHITEWKQSWQDKHLQWICGFANAQGGTLVIGKDDNGNVVGVKRSKKLLTDIPSKIRQQLGLVCAVDLQHEDGLPLIVITTPPYSVPISLRGHYYCRSGSTNIELTGRPLNEFLLKKSGKTWDDIVEVSATIDDIDVDTVQRFVRDAEMAGRIPNISGLSAAQLLDKLRLTEGGQLKRAALVLFGKDPGKFYRNLFVKIGRFHGDDSVVNMHFQEDTEGNLVFLLNDVLQLLERKFLVKPIRFDGVHRIEEWEYPKSALRELLLNALIHRDYTGSMTQIRVHDNRLRIWNSGLLPPELTVEQLTQIHTSFPRNPLLAEACYKAGYIDNWGRGIEKVISACTNADLKEPVFEENTGGMLVTLAKKTTSRFYATANEIGETTNETGKTTNEIGEATNETRETTNEMRKTTSETDKTTNEVGEATSETGKTTNEMRKTTSETGKTTNEVGEATSETGKTTNEKAINQIVTFIRGNDRITAIELGNKLGLSQDGVRYHLKKLKAEGKLARVGNRRWGRWKINDS